MNIKKLIIGFIVVIMLICFPGCRYLDQPGIHDATNEYRLVILSKAYGSGRYETVMYDRNTKVMYVFYGWGRAGGISPIYNSDGSLVLYTADSDAG